MGKIIALKYGKEKQIQPIFHKTMSFEKLPQSQYYWNQCKGGAEVTDLRDCTDVDPTCGSKVYRITPIPGESFDIFCYRDTEQRHWNLIHNRQSSAVDFFRKWTEYKTGFGDLTGNFWLGNDKIYSLVKLAPYRLRIELEAWDGTVGIAEYSDFQIGSEADNYQLYVTGFSGNISDAMHKQNGEMFTTKDRDHDQLSNNCAIRRHGAWWYTSCSAANLNGRYEIDTGDSNEAMAWRFFFVNRQHVPMKKARMMIQRK
ncbi:ficolin-2-like [Pecten maximus]|uniref:ficolin-2-like n=1 Tax=Pecten maximus TaxID=6579 RepID=UPI0014590BE4|nr:ficolin-2-like [Pecten maximus]